MIAAVLLAAILGAESPASAPGRKRWPDPAFTFLPTVVRPGDEARAVLRLPVTIAGGAAVLTWRGRRLPLTLPCADGWTPGHEPPGTPTTLALLALPATPGEATATLDDGPPARVLLTDARAPWPHYRLNADGQTALTADGRAVVLVEAAIDGTQRHFPWLADRPQRPKGRPIIAGDDLGGALAGLPGTRDLTRPAPTAAGLALALADSQVDWPRTLVLSLGAMADGDRLLTAFAQRCHASGYAPRRIALLRTPDPGLALTAAAHDWLVLTVDDLAGAEADLLAPGVRAAGPVGTARDRLRAGLSTHLER